MFKCLVCQKEIARSIYNVHSHPFTSISFCCACWDGKNLKPGGIYGCFYGEVGRIYKQLVHNGQYELARVFAKSVLEKNDV